MSTELNTKNLDALIRALGSQIPKVHIGILQSSKVKNRTITENATIGAKHEFGLDGLPKRSFLLQPLTNLLPKAMENAGFDEPEVIEKIVAERKFDYIATKIGFLAESVVLGAFQSTGYGTWKPSNMKFKRTKITLVETSELRNSITHEVRE